MASQISQPSLAFYLETLPATVIKQVAKILEIGGKTKDAVITNVLEFSEKSTANMNKAVTKVFKTIHK